MVDELFAKGNLKQQVLDAIAANGSLDSADRDRALEDARQRAENTDALNQLVDLSNTVAHVNRQAGLLDNALTNYKKRHEILTKLAAANPRSVPAQRDLSSSYQVLGDVSVQAAKLDDALGFFAAVLRLDPLHGEARIQASACRFPGF